MMLTSPGLPAGLLLVGEACWAVRRVRSVLSARVVPRPVSMKLTCFMVLLRGMVTPLDVCSIHTERVSFPKELTRLAQRGLHHKKYHSESLGVEKKSNLVSFYGCGCYCSNKLFAAFNEVFELAEAWGGWRKETDRAWSAMIEDVRDDLGKCANHYWFTTG